MKTLCYTEPASFDFGRNSRRFRPANRPGRRPIPIYREPSLKDGAPVYALIERSPPLDLNSRYAYFLLCDHFAATSAVAEDEAGQVVGFLGGYRPPTEPDALFVWQVVVDASQRGKKVAPGLLTAILDRPANAAVTKVLATVGPSNRASRRFFEGFAANLSAPFATRPYLAAEDFGAAGHEAEILLRIGPFDRTRLSPA